MTLHDTPTLFTYLGLFHTNCSELAEISEGPMKLWCTFSLSPPPPPCPNQPVTIRGRHLKIEMSPRIKFYLILYEEILGFLLRL